MGMQRTWVRALTTAATLAVMVMIFCFSMQVAEKSDATSGSISRMIVRVLHPEYDQLGAAEQKGIYDSVQHVIRKCGHFTEFALLGLSLRLCLESWFGGENEKQRRLRTMGSRNLGAWLGGTLYAALDELHQLAVDGRSAQVTDVMIDSGGVVTGMLAALLILRIVQKHLSA